MAGLARYLIQIGLLSQASVNDIARSAHKSGVTFVGKCLESQRIDQCRLASAIARNFGLPAMELDSCRPAPGVTVLINSKKQQEHQALPLWVRKGRLVLAVSDPSRTQSIRELEFHTGKTADLVVVPHQQLLNAIANPDRSGYASSNRTRTSDSRSLETNREFQAQVPAGDALLTDLTTLDELNDAPVVHAVNHYLLDAVDRNASDIHIEPYEALFRIRVRIDGVLQELATPPISLARRIISRIKIMAHLDISERRLPQDGRIKLSRLELANSPDNNAGVEFRVSTLPTVWGEKVVLRILDPKRSQLDLDQLGLDSDQARIVSEALARPQGLILVTGPTGSGKTVSLYSALATLNVESRNISTAEDPVELTVPGINQVQIKPAIGFDFATALRSFLRQDPDVLMVGEIRDSETAAIAVKASQTGHLVLSTLHTNNASQTITRLLNLGIEPYNLTASLTLVIAQRLARKLCDYCKKPARLPLSSNLREEITSRLPAGRELYSAAGCDRCHAGFSGRVGIYEVVPISRHLSRTIIAGGNSIDIADEVRKAGYPSLRQSALTRMIDGLTSFEEVIRVT